MRACPADLCQEISAENPDFQMASIVIKDKIRKAF
jgi:hypothetical protein